jgi:putative membrane protein
MINSKQNLVIMKKLKHILLAASVLAMVTACNDTANDASNNDGSVGGSGDTATTSGTNTQGGALAEKDAQFLVDVAASNMAEIKMSQLAQQKGNNQEVKDLGKMLETDHSAVLGEVRSFASNRSVTLPAEEKSEAKDMHNTLNAKSGKEFDKDWCEHMIDMHQKGIAKFESAQNDLVDADLKSWAANTLPKLRTHLDKLNECNKKLK